MNPKVIEFRRLLIFVYLNVVVLSSLLLAFSFRFDFAIPNGEMKHLAIGLVVALPLKLAIFYLTQVHRGWLTFSGLGDLWRIVRGVAVASCLFVLLMYALRLAPAFPRSVYVLDPLLTAALICGARLLIRARRESARNTGRSRSCKGVLIYGAGEAGIALAREIQTNPQLCYRVGGFIDDDPRKKGETLLGLPILGTGHEAARIARDCARRKAPVELILIAMPSASGQEMRGAISACREAELPCKTLPGLGDLLSSRGLTSQIRDIEVEDLLYREPVDFDEAGIRGSLADRVVLVTGAAGSIGSELCRQICSYEPRLLVMFDQAESDLFRIDLELQEHYPELELIPMVGDIRDAGTVDNVIAEYGIETIFHAAAYKHVPLMETHVVEAARNNVIGTWNLAESAVRHKVDTFIMISSDKAVNPTNVMGATKRAAELLVSSFPNDTTRFVSVRFGNVLGSNGSVVPTFKTQIAKGGPVTVTHPEVRRYFMTVREAVHLVLQASIMGKGGEVFVLDMGEPVKIVDLARNLIRLAGLIPDKDIEIRYTGLRPGEKLYEELISEGENIAPTYHRKIKIFQGDPAETKSMHVWLAELRSLALYKNAQGIIYHLSDLIPEYTVSGVWARAESGFPLRARVVTAS